MGRAGWVEPGPQPPGPALRTACLSDHSRPGRSDAACLSHLRRVPLWIPVHTSPASVRMAMRPSWYYQTQPAIFSLGTASSVLP